MAGRWSRVAVALPEHLLLVLLGTSVAVCLALLTGTFRPAVVVPLAVLLSVPLVRLRHRWISPQISPSTTGTAAGAAVAVGIAVVWVVVQWQFTGEAIGVGRDPSQYLLSALHLVDHPTRVVSVDPGLVDLIRRVPGLVVDFNYAGRTPDEVNFVQGTGLLPGLLAVGGWVGGPAAVVSGTTVLGGFALIGTYAAGRLFLGPWWGLGPVVALAVTMPLAEFARTPYTEPVSLALAAALLVALHHGIRLADPWLVGVAGAFAGAAMIARIDGALTTVAAMVALGVAGMVLTLRGGTRVGRLVAAGAAGAALTGGLGWAELRLHSPAYLDDLADQLDPLLALLPVAVVLGLAGTRPPVARWVARVGRRTVRWLPAVAGLAVLVLLSRPWWWAGHGMTDGYVQAVAARQEIAGLEIDGTRSYDEQTLNWMAWYFGWPVLLLGLAGAVLLLRRGLRRPDAALLACWTVPAVVAVVYLNRVSITPDQIWAYRRLLPVLTPALLIAAWFLVRAVTRRVSTRWVRTTITAVAVAVTLVDAAWSWQGLFPVREGTGVAAAVRKVCAAADGGLLVQAGPAPAVGTLLPAYQQACGLRALAVDTADPRALAVIAGEWTGGPVTVVVSDPSIAVWTQPAGDPDVVVDYVEWESPLDRKPSEAVPQRLQLWIGTLGADGELAAGPTGAP
ncbi:hypothetical protein GIS00_07375 [Nakamurella sp. YIM 132087]|uniref:Glycosyltransferase RgtA/B/C/D-like domain-containing protein n=1 Tax=Nakamurella alba TaxID=2665158 RepID=A0A7K1FKJ2_9ACTN|nr:hypothetical protein [Nakamurella alba]MTD13763.1 hypothetical protein [Nakamurella alba]